MRLDVIIKFKEKICLIHCPMSNKKFNQTYTIKYLGNVIEGQIIKYLNVSIDEMKSATIKSIKNNEAVWFGCDVGKMFHRDIGVMYNGLYKYDLLLVIKYNYNKRIFGAGSAIFIHLTKNYKPTAGCIALKKKDLLILLKLINKRIKIKIY